MYRNAETKDELENDVFRKNQIEIETAYWIFL